jgi:hypothetical protein
LGPIAANVTFYAANFLYCLAYVLLVGWPRSTFVTRKWVPLVHPLLLTIPYIVLAAPHLAAGIPKYASLEGIASLMANSDIQLATWLDLMALLPVAFSLVVRDLVARGASRVKIVLIVLLGSMLAPLGFACFVIDKWVASRRTTPQANGFEF